MELSAGVQHRTEIVGTPAGHVSAQCCRDHGAMRRLYVGGLSHTVTEKDLKDRFGKFGAVEDVELRTRRDPEGVPFKTFGYVNINISDADLKKCLTVLNKSKWKGGTLQIEIAKESFLHRCKVLHVTEQTDVKDSSKAQKKEVTPRINTIGVNSMQEATKLAQERQEAAEQHLRQPAAEDKRQKLLDSLSKSGVDNFTMKAAVPGTEIPGHKDWVVSKFGRVLPILQLRKGNKSRTLKYDPSKYSHNIRKLDRNAMPDEFTPITQLTWEVQGGDDDISKKRRGEFPPSEPWRPKKSRTDDASGRTRFEHPVNCVSYSEAHRLSNGFEKQNNHRPAQRKWTHFSDSDVDSDEEIRRLVAAQQSSRFTPQQQQQQEVEEETLEVVGYDFLSKSSRKGDQEDDDDDDYDSADTDELFASRKPPPPECQEKHTPPTVEHLSGNNMDTKRQAKKSKAGEREEEDGSTDDEEHLTSRKPSSVQQKGDSEQKLNKKTAVVKPSLSQSDSDEDDENEVDSADSCSDSDYEAMFSNVTHLEISLADLQKLAEEAQQNSRTTAPSILGAKLEQKRTLTSGPAEQSAPKKGTTPEEILAAIMEDDSSEDEQKKKKTKRKAVMSAPLPAFQGTKAISEVSETDERKKGQEEEEEEEDGRGREVKKQRMNSDAPQLVHKATDGKTSTSVRDQKHAEAKISDSSGQEEDDEEDDNEEHESDDVEEEEDMAAPDVFKMIQNRVCVIPEKAEIESSSSNDDEEEEEEERVNACQTVVKAKSSSSSCSSSGDDENEQQIICAEGPVEAALSSETSTSEEEEEEEERPPPQMALGVEEGEERQRQANMRRLAAVQQRQKEAEEHKRLIQGALASLDAPAAGAGKHIVFGSDDDEDDGDDKGRMVSEVSTSKKTLFQDSQSEDEADGDEAAANGGAKVKEKSSGPQLFGSSDDEDDDAEKEEEEDGSRFDIKPQFEGQAGQKLMALQSRFGTDERFRMDSRFLEEDEEDKEEESRETADAETKNTLVEDDEDLEEEKKKNLSILQSVLGQQQCSSKTAGKAKKFRDVSALHYDPSKEEHAAFETKKDEIKKESKAARKKKREEAQKLPEVPKEIYYDVSGDLKAVFGQSKHETAEQEEKTNWDQMEEEEGTEKEEEFAPLASVLSAPGAENEDSSGFKFSFFGDDTEAESKETAEYKVEAIQAPKVSWQQDPRFHDSSSEEEEDEQEEDEEQSSATAKTTEAVTPSHTEFFFFCTDDDRLTEGPKLFCRVLELEEQREHWEERRSALRQEYRKKHRDAKRKLTSSLKS